MSLQQAVQQVMADVAEVGALARQAASGYERIFSNLRSVLGTAAAAAPSLAEAALGTMEIADAAAAALFETFPGQPKYDCRSGCSPCCHLYVMVPPGIAAAIVDHLAAHVAPEDRGPLRERLQAAAAAAAAVDDPVRLRHRCPLLGPDDRCSVYAVRPLSCRAFTSTNVGRCRQVCLDANGSGMVDQNPSHFRIYAEATFAMEQAARARGSPADQLGLAQALLDLMPPDDWRAPAHNP